MSLVHYIKKEYMNGDLVSHTEHHDLYHKKQRISWRTTNLETGKVYTGEKVFNQKNQLIKEIRENGTKILHTYDDAGLLVQTTTYWADGTTDIVKYTYDNLGCEIKCIGHSPCYDSIKTTAYYGPHFIQSEEIRHGVDGNMDIKVISLYDDIRLLEKTYDLTSGKLLHKQVVFNEGKSSIEAEYDENGEKHYSSSTMESPSKDTTVEKMYEGTELTEECITCIEKKAHGKLVKKDRMDQAYCNGQTIMANHYVTLIEYL